MWSLGPRSFQSLVELPRTPGAEMNSLTGRGQPALKHQRECEGAQIVDPVVSL